MAIHGLGNLQSTKIAKASISGVWKSIASVAKGLEETDINAKQVIDWNLETRTWNSNFVDSGGFSVSLLRRRLDRAKHQICDGPFFWPKEVPQKINCFVLRAKLGLILTLSTLKKRNVNAGDPICGVCSAVDEDADHVLVVCPLATQVLAGIWKWCGIRMDAAEKVMDTINLVIKWGSCKKKRRGLVSIIYGAFWCLWRSRNDRIFNGVATNPVKILEDTKALTYVWYKHRAGKGDLSWSDWLESPLSCL